MKLTEITTTSATIRKAFRRVWRGVGCASEYDIWDSAPGQRAEYYCYILFCGRYRLDRACRASVELMCAVIYRYRAFSTTTWQARTGERLSQTEGKVSSPYIFLSFCFGAFALRCAGYAKNSSALLCQGLSCAIVRLLSNLLKPLPARYVRTPEEMCGSTRLPVGFTHPSIHPSIHPSTHPSIHPPIHLPIHLPIHPCLASRIMRKENYLIAMLNKRILKLSLPLPFLGSRGSGTLWATTGRQYLTKSLEWSVHFCVLNHMFSDKVGAFFLGSVTSRERRTVRWPWSGSYRASFISSVSWGCAHFLPIPLVETQVKTVIFFKFSDV